jgi:hypothetical protein
MTNIFISYCAGVMVTTITIIIIVYNLEMKGKGK